LRAKRRLSDIGISRASRDDNALHKVGRPSGYSEGGESRGGNEKSRNNVRNLCKHVESYFKRVR